MIHMQGDLKLSAAEGDVVRRLLDAARLMASYMIDSIQVPSNHDSASLGVATVNPRQFWKLYIAVNNAEAEAHRLDVPIPGINAFSCLTTGVAILRDRWNDFIEQANAGTGDWYNAQWTGFAVPKEVKEIPERCDKIERLFRLAEIPNAGRRETEITGEEQKSAGRPRKYDPQKDARLYEDWQAAKANGSTLEEFAASRGMVLSELKRAINRHEKNVRRGRI